MNAVVRRITSARPVQERIRAEKEEQKQKEDSKNLQELLGFYFVVVGACCFPDGRRKFMCEVYFKNKGFGKHTFNFHLPYYQTQEKEFSLEDELPYCLEKNMMRVHKTKYESFIQIEMLPLDEWDLSVFEEHGEKLTKKNLLAFMSKGPNSDIPTFTIKAKFKGEKTQLNLLSNEELQAQYTTLADEAMERMYPKNDTASLVARLLANRIPEANPTC